MFRILTMAAGILFAAEINASDIGTINKESAGKLYKKDSYSPYAGRNFPTQVFWGDTHLHTNLSMDAGAFGNRLGLEEAYRFSKGEEVTSSSGITAKLSRPMDFTVIADHSDTALDGLRCEVLQAEAAEARTHDHPGTGLYFANLVQPLGGEDLLNAIESPPVYRIVH
jgi:hypothetical protein